MDRLNDLPSCLIEMILCFIPIQEAGRTSILSKEWRYRWTKIPKLVFKEGTFQVSHARQKMDKRCKLIYTVRQVLLMHDCPIHEFTLSMRISNTRLKIDRIITRLSRKTSLKKLKLDFGKARLQLPSSIFSFHQLTDLYLSGCCFDHESTFYKFDGLITSLILKNVSISASMLQQILSSCPLLKTVFMNIPCSHITSNNGGFTYKELFELFECLPVVETLYLSFDLINVLKDFKDYFDSMVPRELLTPLFHLKSLFIYRVCFTREEDFILAFLIKNSPNLEKLKILDGLTSRTSMNSSSSETFYQGIMLEHLNELEIKDFVIHDYDTRFDFVKIILARSPVLKTVRIFPFSYREKKSQILEILLGYSRASPDVQIIVENPCKAARKMPV